MAVVCSLVTSAIYIVLYTSSGYYIEDSAQYLQLCDYYTGSDYSKVVSDQRRACTIASLIISLTELFFFFFFFFFNDLCNVCKGQSS